VEERLHRGDSCTRTVQETRSIPMGDRTPTAQIEYCPECTWNLYSDFFLGNNGLVEKFWCSFCGWSNV
jgi:hypothetical protein